MRIEQLKDIIQSTHINFMLGSGLSVPYLKTLSNIENWLTQCSNIQDKKVRLILEDNLKMAYVEDVMKPCLFEYRQERKEDLSKVKHAYKDFLRCWNYIISHRGGGLLSKQVNLFTTNIDPFVEESAEDLGIEFNNGFKGVITPTLREESFNSVVSKVSPLYQKTSETPTFNYFKIHGSINWKVGRSENEIVYDRELSVLKEVVDVLNSYPEDYKILEIAQRNQSEIEQVAEENTEITFDDLENLACDLTLDRRENDDERIVKENFREAYNKLVMIHPRKTKFRETVLDLHFYELMRLYSNALEQSSTCLFVAGFSFADEHIAQITLRAASANPTLLIVIFAYNDEAGQSISNFLRGCNNNNIIILTPKTFYEAQNEAYVNRLGKTCDVFDLESINKYVFEPIVYLIK